MSVIKLNHGKLHHQYICEITDYLDEQSNWKRHYIYADQYGIKNKCVYIRTPGRTVGGIWFNDKHQITDIKVDHIYNYSKDPVLLNEKLQTLFIGKTLEIE